MVRETLSVSTRDRTANSAACKKESSAEGAVYRVGAELAPEPAGTAAELVQLVPAASVVGGVAWRALCCGWLRG